MTTLQEAAQRALIQRLREHDDPRLYREADELMSEAADALAALASEPQAEPVAFCALTPCGNIAYFDGKPMVMAGASGWLSPLGQPMAARIAAGKAAAMKTLTQWPTPTGERAQEHEALKLADQLATEHVYGVRQHVVKPAADTIRRQHSLVVQMREALAPFAVYGRPGSRDIEVGEAIGAITAANDYLGKS